MNAPPPSLVVTADDRTGATEAAAACADAGWRVVVVPFGSTLPLPPRAADCVVIDLRSRHIAPEEAQRRVTAASVDAGATVGVGAHRVHKIDSTLRGNWAEELTALVELGRRVLLIPAHPPAGRTAVGGIVRVDGVPVAESHHGDDPRLPVTTSRPGDRLPGVELAGADAVAAWIAGTDPVAIADAETMDDIGRLVAAALGADDVVIAGSASVVGVVARACAPTTVPRGLPDPLLPRPVVAVCASLHPAGRAQVAALAAAGFEVVTSSEVRGDDPEAIAAEVAERAHRQVAAIGAHSVILVGGDTAAAFMGDAVVEVFGLVDVGISVGEAVIGGRRLRVVTKPGGFGTANTLVDLMTSPHE